MIATADDAPALVRDADRAAARRVRAVRPATPARASTLHSGMKVDLKVVAPDQFGNVLQHFTGSKDHNVALREAAVRRGLHVSEYGILDDATGETLRCATEEDVYERLGLPWIPPELREGRGELEAAAAGTLPELVTLEDLRGDLHSHTTLSDGRQDARGDGRGRARARLRVPRDHRPLGHARVRQPRRRPTRCARRSSASARSTPGSTTSSC